MDRETEKKLVMTFDNKTDDNLLNELIKKMINNLDVEELAIIETCKLERTFLFIEKNAE